MKSNHGKLLFTIIGALIIFCVNVSYAQESEADVNLQNRDTRLTNKKFDKISSTALRAFIQHLTDPSDTETLEKLVAISKDFINKYPSSQRIGEVYYYYGKALIKLGQVDAGITILEKLIQTIPENQIAVTDYADQMGDTLKWSPHEHGLLELGLAYDKQNAQDKADKVYKKLITHPDYADGMQAQIARQVLETDGISRTGEAPKSHTAWNNQIAPIFQISSWKGILQKNALNHYQGKIVLLYYDTTDTQRLNLKQLHEKYKNQQFQIISANPDFSYPPGRIHVVDKGEAWIHYHDRHGKLASMYQIRSLPAVFLIDSEGVIKKTDLNNASLEEAVGALITKNLATYDDSRTQEIVDAAVKAHGGLQKLKAVESIVMNTRVFEHFPDGTSKKILQGKAYFYRDKLRIESHGFHPPYKHTEILDGTSLYQSGGGEFIQIDPKRDKSIIDQYKDIRFREPIPIRLMPTLAQNAIPVQFLGTEDLKGETVFVLRVRQPSGKALKIYISKESSLVVQLIFNDLHVVDTIVELKQYKEVDGINISHHYVSKDESHRETHFSNITLNAEIDPKLFEPTTKP